MDNAALKDTVLKLKERIIRTEAGNMQLSETDTRQGLINPLFRANPLPVGRVERHGHGRKDGAGKVAVELRGARVRRGNRSSPRPCPR